MPDPATTRRRWPVPRSLRARITLVATVGVLLALAVASAALVSGIRGSLVGQTQEAAEHQVGLVARELAADRLPDPSQLAGTNPPVAVLVRGPDGILAGTQAQALFLRAPVTDILRRLDTLERRAGDELVAATIDDLVVARRAVNRPDGEYTVVAISPLADVSRSIDTVGRALMIATPVMTALVGLLCWHVVGRALRPVEVLRRRADDISHTNLGERLPVAATGDEIERLSVTLNDMLGRLAGALRRQREFVSDTAHELRTPLATMRTELEVALAHLGAGGWRATAEQLLVDQGRLEKLAHDLLMLARLDEGVGLRSDALRLDEVVAGETTALPDDAVRLQPLVVHGDHDALAGAVRNLVDNACRHTAERVEVSVHGDDGHAVVRVDDDGPGVPADQRARIFERFARVDAARARSDGGTGIGLAIVRSVAEAHDGAITVGDAPSGGARFELRLPPAARPPAPGPTGARS